MRIKRNEIQMNIAHLVLNYYFFSWIIFTYVNSSAFLYAMELIDESNSEPSTRKFLIPEKKRLRISSLKQFREVIMAFSWLLKHFAKVVRFIRFHKNHYAIPVNSLL